MVLTSILSRNSRSFLAKSAGPMRHQARVIYIIFCGFCSAVAPVPAPAAPRALSWQVLPPPPEADRRPAGAPLRPPGGEEASRVRPGSGPRRRVAMKGAQRIAIDGALGLASLGGRHARRPRPCRTSAALLALEAGRRKVGRGRGGAVLLLEAVRSLRRAPVLPPNGVPQDMVVPAEGRAVRADAGRGRRAEARSWGGRPAPPRSSASRPGRGRARAPLQVGRKLYYKSKCPSRSSFDSLRTIDSDGADPRPTCRGTRSSLFQACGSTPGIRRPSSANGASWGSCVSPDDPETSNWCSREPRAGPR